jgi:sacsin
MGELGAALVSAGMPLVDVTPEVCVKFQQACPTLRYLTPQLLRRQLTKAGGRKPKLTDRTTVVLALR